MSFFFFKYWFNFNYGHRLNGWVMLDQFKSITSNTASLIATGTHLQSISSMARGFSLSLSLSQIKCLTANKFHLQWFLNQVWLGAACSSRKHIKSSFCCTCPILPNWWARFIPNKGKELSTKSIHFEFFTHYNFLMFFKIFFFFFFSSQRS